MLQATWRILWKDDYAFLKHLKTKRNDTQDDDSGVASCRGLWASTCFASNNLAGVEIVEIVDTNGHLVSKVHGEGSSQLTTKITQGIQVALVNMEGGECKNYKMMFHS